MRAGDQAMEESRTISRRSRTRGGNCWRRRDFSSSRVASSSRMRIMHHYTAVPCSRQTMARCLARPLPPPSHRAGYNGAYLQESVPKVLSSLFWAMSLEPEALAGGDRGRVKLAEVVMNRRDLHHGLARN